MESTTEGRFLGPLMDLPVRMEHMLSNILPMALFFFSTSYLQYLTAPFAATGSWGGQCLKLTVSGTILAAEVSSLLFWAPAIGASYCDPFVVASAVPCIAAVYVTVAHLTFFRYNAFHVSRVSLLLTFSVISDGLKWNIYNYGELKDLAYLSLASMILKSALLLSEVKWRHFIFHDFPIGALNVLRVTFFAGQLEDLGPEYSAEALSEKFYFAWSNADKHTYGGFCKVLWFMVYKPASIGAVVCLTKVWLVYLQPNQLRRVIIFIEDPASSGDTGRDLVRDFIVLQVGIMLLRAIQDSMTHQVAIMLRGLLTSSLLRKSLHLVQESDAREHTVDLASTDIETCVSKSIAAQRVLSQFAECSVGAFMLVNRMEHVAPLHFIPFIACIAAGSLVSKFGASAWITWQTNAHRRAMVTSRALSQIQNFKVIGLESVVSDYMLRLRSEENEYLKNPILFMLFRMLFSSVTWTLAPMTAMAGSWLFISAPEMLIPSEAFFIYAIATLMTESLMGVMSCNEALGSWSVHMARIYHFFAADEMLRFNSPRRSSFFKPIILQSDETSSPDDFLDGHAVMFSHVTVWRAGSDKLVLDDASFSIQRSTTAMIIGPVGCGKSTICRLILGEVRAQHGLIRRQRGPVAFCSQIPWIWDSSIRDNILGENAFDQLWYSTVVDACFLNDGMELLPNRDMSRAGSHGSNLNRTQQIQVAIARAVYSRAPLLVFDEIFSGVGKNTANRILENLCGPGGLLRKSGSTVLLATNSLDYTRFADQTIFIDELSQVFSVSDLAAVTLSEDYVNKLSQLDNSKRRMQNSVTSFEVYPSLEEDSLRELHKYSFNHLSFLFRASNMFLVLFWVVSTAASSLVDHLPHIFWCAWLGGDAGVQRDLHQYAFTAALVCFAVLSTRMLFLLKLFPETVQSLYFTILNRAIKATLSFQSSSNMEYMRKRFGTDVSFISKELPIRIHNIIYLGSHVIIGLGAALSGTRSTTITVPVFLGAAYFIHRFYLQSILPVLDLTKSRNLMFYRHLRHILDGADHIRSFEWEEQTSNQSLQALEHSQRFQYDSYTIDRRLKLALDVFAMAIGILVIAAITGNSGSASVAAAGLSLSKLLPLSDNLSLLAPCIIDAEKAMSCIARMRRFILATPQEARDASVKVRLPPNWPREGNITFSRVTAQYSPTGNDALFGVSLRAYPGEKVAIVGGPGSGKTTIFRTLLNFLEYTGTIEIDGVDIRTIPKEKLRSSITSISQDVAELDGSIVDNLLPYRGQKESPRMRKSVLCEMLEKVGIMDVVRRRGGIDAPLQEMNFTESELQRLCIARALLHNLHTQSKVVLMDEATSHMDDDTDRHIQAVMGEAFADCTVLVIAERLETFHDVDFYVMLQGGIRAVPNFQET